MIRLTTPLKKEDVLKLKAGDKVFITGTIFTARDRAHQFFVNSDYPKIKDSIIYHCGPIVKDNIVVAAGPTTSSRMNPYTPKVIETYGVKAIIGKGGMDSGVLDALKGKAVYLSAIGGAGIIYSDSITLKGVDKLSEFGAPEAIWEFSVKDFPAIVTMDSHGNSLYEDILKSSGKEFEELIKK